MSASPEAQPSARQEPGVSGKVSRSVQHDRIGAFHRGDIVRLSGIAGASSGGDGDVWQSHRYIGRPANQPAREWTRRCSPDFNTFLSKAQAVRYFDDQANELPDTKGAIYYVNVRTLAAVTVPGATDANSNLAGITVQIATNPGGKKLALDSSNLWPADPTVPMTAYSTFLAGYCAQ